MEFVADAMIDMGVPDAVVNCQAANAFLGRVGKPVYETLRVLCLNRARQRSSLEAQMQVSYSFGYLLIRLWQKRFAPSS